MMRTSMLAGAAVLAFALAGCGNDKHDAPTAPSGKAAAMPASPSGTPAAVANNDDIPSEADFEEEAEKDITADNLESELANLEKEIGAE